MTTLLGNASVVTLTDGARVLMRDAQCDDWEALRRMYLGLTDQTRYLYFCAGVPANDTWAARFATLGQADGQVAYALVATVEETVVGLARFDRGADGRSASQSSPCASRIHTLAPSARTTSVDLLSRVIIKIPPPCSGVSCSEW